MHGDADENDGIEFANQRAMCDYLAETSASPMSLSTNNRSQGFPLCNTRNQLHKLDALYDDDEEQSLCLNHSSMDRLSLERPWRVVGKPECLEIT